MFVYLFWPCCTSVAACGFSPVATSRGYSWLWCAALSLQWRLLCSMGSRRGLQKLQHVGSKLPHGTEESSQIRYWTLSPTLAGRLLTTGPPGKPCCNFIIIKISFPYANRDVNPDMHSVPESSESVWDDQFCQVREPCPQAQRRF